MPSYSTALNFPAPMNPPPPNDAAGEETETVQEDEAAQPAEKEKGTKHKTKSQNEWDSNIDKIMYIAQVEDHPVELALTAIGKQMIRSLDSDKQDKLLDQIQSVSATYFCKRHQRSKRNVVQEPVQSAVLWGPPPLTPARQPAAQAVQHAEIQQMQDDMLVEVGSLPLMEQYNVQHVAAAQTGATYMKLNWDVFALCFLHHVDLIQLPMYCSNRVHEVGFVPHLNSISWRPETLSGPQVMKSLVMILLASGFLGVRKLCITVVACITLLAFGVLRYVLLSKILQCCTKIPKAFSTMCLAWLSR